MKKLLSILCWSLFALFLLFPVAVLCVFAFGWSVSLLFALPFTLLIAAVGIVAVIVSFRNPCRQEQKGIRLLPCLLLPLSLQNLVFFLIKGCDLWSTLCLLISVGCCVFLMIREGKPLTLKIIFGAISGMLALPIGLICFFSLVMLNFGRTTVVQTLESPSGCYCVDVIDDDQGGLGGSTYVDLRYQTPAENALEFFGFRVIKRLYWGDWGDYAYLQIHWEDDNRLIIKNIGYSIP